MVDHAIGRRVMFVRYEIYCLTVGYFLDLPRAALMSGVGFGEVVPKVPINVFLIKGGPEPIIFDAGCSASLAAERKVGEYIPPAQMLRRLGLEADDVATLVISHLHW